MEYMVVEAGSAAELAQKVTDRMNDGWMPAGGVAVGPNGYGAVGFYQAVVLLPEDPEGEDEE